MTTRVAKTLLILPALLALCACGCGKKPYWPLEKGNEWVYQEHIRVGSTPTGEWRYVVQSVTGAGRNRRAVIQVFRDRGADPVQEITLTMTPDGIYESRRWLLLPDVGSGAGEQETETLPGNDNLPFILLAKPAVNQTWSFDFTRQDALTGAVLEYKGRGEVGRETAAPLAGRFKTLRVTWTAALKDGSGEETLTYWFAKGVGPVKIDTQVMGMSAVLMLEKAKIGRKKIGKW